MSLTKTWWPDTCRGGRCRLEVVDGHRGLVAIHNLCTHHFSRRGVLGNDRAFFDDLLATQRAKNYGTYEVAKELAGARAVDEPGGANEIHASLQFRIDDQDRVIIPIFDSSRRATYQAKVDARVGAGKVICEDALAPRSR